MIISNSFKKQQRTLTELVEAQVKFETSMKITGMQRFDRDNTRAEEHGAASETAWNNIILNKSVDAMAKVIEAYIDYYKGRRGRPSQSLTFLQLLTPHQAGAVTIKTILDLMAKTDIHITTIAERVGRKIEDEVRFSKLEETAPEYIQEIKKSLAKKASTSYSHKRKVLNHVGEKLAKEGQTAKWSKWVKADVILLGSLLIDMFQEHVTFNGEALIKREVIYQEGNKAKKQSRLVLTGAALDWIQEFKDNVAASSPAYAACVIEPRDWIYNSATQDQEGGYHVPEVADTLNMIRGRRSQRARNTGNQCPVVYKTLNGLQKTAWTVASQVALVANHVLSNKLPLAMPSHAPLQAGEAPIPAELRDLEGKELFSALTTAEQKEFMSWKEHAAEVATKELQRKSDLLKIGRILAETAKYDTFENLYYVYSLDFRSRVYAQGSLLTPQGEDLQKGLLRFSRGMELGSDGYDWLAFQGANVWGEDKITLEDRTTFIENMNPQIMAIACDPLSNTEWVNADKPWQFLNWCFEWADLMQWVEEGNEVETFVSHLPIANDGSCSGIQHYSAMLQDPVGGASVNLIPSDLPQDIYGEVAKILTEKLQELATDEDAETANLARQWLMIEGGITRTLCKPPVMTTPYGSTQISCRKTCKEYLIDIQNKENKKALAGERAPKDVHGFKKNMNDALGFLVPHLWKAIGEVVKAARLAMQMINEVAKKLSKENNHMEVCTPTGFIFEQKIWQMKDRIINTQMFGRINMTLLEPIVGKIDGRKMGTSAAPNFVHSMDASHLILACALMLDKGIKDIAVIHDSFGTHAGNTTLLRECLLGSFVKMYKENNVLQQLVDWNEEIHFTDLEVSVPSMMGLDLDVILKSVYCFA